MTTKLTFEQKLAKEVIQVMRDHDHVRMEFIRRRAKVRPDVTFLMRNRFERAQELSRAKNGK